MMLTPRHPLLVLATLCLILAILVDFAEAASLRKYGKHRSSPGGRDKKGKGKGKIVTPRQHPTFCSRYRLACIAAASADKTTWGDEAVVFSCRKCKNNVVYKMGCRYNGKDYSSAALARIAASGGVSTSISDGGTVSVTSYTRATETLYAVAATTTITPDTQTTTTSTSTTLTVPETTQVTTTTTDISIETSLTSMVTSTATETVPYTVTTTRSADTSTFAQVDTQVFPVGVFQLADGSSWQGGNYTVTGGNLPPPRRALKKEQKDQSGGRTVVDPSVFCSAYTKACYTECARVKFTPRYQVCLQHKSIKDRYSLSCFCQNRKVETQHALAKVGMHLSISVVSSISTAQTTVTSTGTMVRPLTATTVQATPTATITNTERMTETSTATITATSVTATTTRTTSVVGSVLSTTTSVPTATATESVSPSSTIYLVAPTGIIRGLDANDEPNGYLGRSTRTSNRYGLNRNRSNAYAFTVTRDQPSGMLRFQELFSGLTFGGEAGFQGDTFAQGTAAYAWFIRAPIAAAQPGPPSGAGPFGGNKYATWIVDTVAAPPANSSIGSVELRPAWINPDGSKFNSTTLAWDSENANYSDLGLVADPAALVLTYPGEHFSIRLFFGPA